MSEPAVAVLGAGAWGTALAVCLARGGYRVTLCVRRVAQLELLTIQRENPYLAGIVLPESIALSADWPAALAQAEFVIVAIPSAFVREMVAPLASDLRPGTTLISATKGLEVHSQWTMTQALARLVSPQVRIAALSGPGFAAEIARGKPAALVAAAGQEAVAETVQRLLSMPFLRVYRSTDVVGVELGGAVKNVIAIAAGISDGLGLGASARAALITRGLAEMMRLGTAMGAQRDTLAGLAGLGDLVLTCTGELSRNRSFGLRLATGPRPHRIPGEGMQIAEGTLNARLVRDLGAHWQVELPIVAAVCRCLYEDQSAQAMVEGLFSRELKAEF